MGEFIISDHLITNGEDAALYEEEIEKKDVDKPARMKWKIAADFCNKLSQKMGLEPCYCLDEEGLEYECNFENNGWRIPSLEELKNTDSIGAQFEWTNDESGSRWDDRTGRIRVMKDEDGINASDYDPDEKYPFRICRVKSNKELDLTVEERRTIKRLCNTGKWDERNAIVGVRARFKCEYCGKDLFKNISNYKEWQLDHIVPISGGGQDDLENIALSCRFCNVVLKRKWNIKKDASIKLPEKPTRLELIKAIAKHLKKVKAEKERELDLFRDIVRIEDIIK